MGAATPTVPPKGGGVRQRMMSVDKNSASPKNRTSAGKSWRRSLKRNAPEIRIYNGRRMQAAEGDQERTLHRLGRRRELIICINLELGRVAVDSHYRGGRTVARAFRD
jgi:hypothetical protein